MLMAYYSKENALWFQYHFGGRRWPECMMVILAKSSVYCVPGLLFTGLVVMTELGTWSQAARRASSIVINLTPPKGLC